MSEKICKDCLHYKMCLEKFRKLKEENEYISISEDDYFSSADDCDLYIVNAQVKENTVKEAESELCDNQIEELAKVIDELLVDKPTEITLYALNEATHLYNNGYRKASDVAREIFAEIETRMSMRGIPTISLFALDIDKLKKKYESEGNK